MALFGNTDVLADAPKNETPSITVDATSTDVVDTTNNTITHAGHHFVDGDKLNYRDGGGTAIAGLTDEGEYFVVSRTADTFKLSATSGGSAISLTAVGVGTSHVFQTAQHLYFIDTTEAAVATNRAKGLKTAGWNKYEEYGTGRIKVETLVAMSETASDAGDDGITGTSSDEDAEAADS